MLHAFVFFIMAKVISFVVSFRPVVIAPAVATASWDADVASGNGGMPVPPTSNNKPLGKVLRAFYARKAEFAKRIRWRRIVRLGYRLPVQEVLTITQNCESIREPSGSTTLVALKLPWLAKVVSRSKTLKLCSVLMSGVPCVPVKSAEELREMTCKAINWGNNCSEPVTSLSVDQSANVLKDAIYAINIEAFVRASGGKRGIVEILERAIPVLKEEMWKHSLSDKEMPPWWGDVTKDITYFELPSRQGYSDYQNECLDLGIAKWEVANRAVVYQGANSAIGVKAFDSQDRRTPLAILLDMLSGPQGCIDVQQYAMSVLGATVSAPLGDSEGSLQGVGVKVLAYDFKKPIGQEDGTPIYLSDAGTDGGCLISVHPSLFPSIDKEEFKEGNFDKFDRIMGGQLRGLTKSGIVKGAGWPSFTYAGEAGKDLDRMKTFKLEVTDGKPTLLLDINMFKGGLKQHPAVLAAKSEEAPNGYAVEITDDMWCWFIMNQRHVEETRMSQGSSFQETPFRLNPKLDVDPDRMLTKFLDSIATISNKDQANALETFILRTKGRFSNIDDTPTYQLPMVQSVDRGIDRLASSGDRREAHIRYVRACSLLPCGSVITTKQSWDKTKGKIKVLSKVALKRTPNLLYSCLSTAWGLTMPLINAFDHVESEDLDEGIGQIFEDDDPVKDELEAMYEKGDLYGSLKHDRSAVTWRELIEDLKLKHNREVLKRSYQDNKVLTFDQMFKRLKKLAIAMRSVPHLNGCFYANPEDGRDRQEDHDGDYTVCDGQDWIVEIHEDAEESTQELNTVIIEYPKPRAVDWRREKLKVNICGRMEINPKGMKILEMFPNPDSFELQRCIEIAKVTTVDPQGPTGLWSNAGADIFARINWKQSSTEDGARWYALKPKTEQDQKLYYLWIICALCVQLSIDWQKRAFELFSLGKWKRLAELIVKAGKEGRAVNPEELAELGAAPNLETKIWIGKNEYDLLAPNWCFSPEVVYPWVNSVLAQIYGDDIDFKPAICTWKQKGDGTWRDANEIQQQLTLYSKQNLFYRVQNAAHGKDGWLKPALDIVAKSSQRWATNLHVGLVEKMGKIPNEEQKTAYFAFANKVNRAIPSCMRAVTLMHDISHKDDSAISKLSPKLRGNTYLRQLGFTSEHIKTLSTPIEEGGGPTAVHLTNHLVIDIEMLIAMLMKTPAKEGRGMTAAWQILLSWWVSCNTTPESLKEFYRYAGNKFDHWAELANKRFSGHRLMVPRGSWDVVRTQGGGIKLPHQDKKVKAAEACDYIASSLEEVWESWVLKGVKDGWLLSLWKEVEGDEIQYKLMVKTIFRSFVAGHRAMKHLGGLRRHTVFTKAGKRTAPAFFSPSGGSRAEYDLLMPQEMKNPEGTGYYNPRWFLDTRKSEARGEDVGIAYQQGKQGLQHFNRGPSGGLKHVPTLNNAVSDPCALTWRWKKGQPPVAPAPIMKHLYWIEDLLEDGWVVKSNSCFGKKHGYLDHVGYWLSQRGLEDEESFSMVQDLCLMDRKEFTGVDDITYAKIRRGYGAGTELSFDALTGRVAVNHVYMGWCGPMILDHVEKYIGSVVGLPMLKGKDVENMFKKPVRWDKQVLVKLIAGIILREADHEVGLKEVVAGFNPEYDRKIMNVMWPIYEEFKEAAEGKLDDLLYNPVLWTTKKSKDRSGKFNGFFFKKKYDNAQELIKFIEAYKTLGR